MIWRRRENGKNKTKLKQKTKTNVPTQAVCSLIPGQPIMFHWLPVQPSNGRPQKTKPPFCLGHLSFIMKKTYLFDSLVYFWSVNCYWQFISTSIHRHFTTQFYTPPSYTRSTVQFHASVKQEALSVTRLRHTPEKCSRLQQRQRPKIIRNRVNKQTKKGISFVCIRPQSESTSS